MFKLYGFIYVKGEIFYVDYFGFYIGEYVENWFYNNNVFIWVLGWYVVNVFFIWWIFEYVIFLMMNRINKGWLLGWGLFIFMNKLS